MLASLTDDDIEMLIASHWRELKGLMKEINRRKGKNVPKPD